MGGRKLHLGKKISQKVEKRFGAMARGGVEENRVKVKAFFKLLPPTGKKRRARTKKKGAGG